MTSRVPISKTKIVVPQRRPELISRGRLLEKIRGSVEHKLTLLSAPAGYGKTSLLLDFAHSADLPVCWLSLDLLDRDPQRFVAYVIAALAERFPGITPPLQSMLDQLKSIEDDAEPLLVALTNEIYDQAEGDFLFVLDDYHLIENVPAISRLLNRFLQLVDENCHLILASRVPPVLPDLTLMVAREQVHGLNQIELAFSPREIQSYLAQINHQYVSDEAAQSMVERTGGWITGIILSNQTGSAGAVGADTFEYLSRQVLDQQPPHLREFLLRTSLADVFDAELCESTLSPLYADQPNWSELIDEVLKRNLFVLRLGETHERWLRYHPLFREFLQVRLKEDRPGEVKPILERLTRAYEYRGEWEKAYQTCEQLVDAEALAELVERSGTPMLQGAFTTLDGWLMNLPADLVRERPGLVSLRGAMAIMKGKLQEALRFFQRAETLYRESGDTAGLTLVLVRRAFAQRELGNYAASLQDIEETLKLGALNPHLRTNTAEALRIKGFVLLQLGQSTQGVKCLESSLALYRTLDEPGSVASLLGETAIAYVAVGDLGTGQLLLKEAVSLREKANNHHALAYVLNNLAVLYQQVGDYTRAGATLERALSCARKSHNGRAETLILLSMGDLFAEIEDYESARIAYRTAEPIAKRFSETFNELYLILATAKLAMLMGDKTRAHRILRHSRKKLEINQSLYLRGLQKLVEGQLDLVCNRADRAIVALKDCKSFFLSDDRDLERKLSCVWLVAAECEMQDFDSARNEMKSVLGDSNPPNHYVVVAVRQAGQWLASLRSDPEIKLIARDLFERADQFGEQLGRARRELRRQICSVRAASPHMVVRAFGPARVWIDGEQLTAADWRTQSVRELFFFLLAAARPMTKGQIALTLWPDAEEATRLKLRFKNEVYRLRRTVGRDTIRFENENYQFNHKVDYEYDVEAFDSYVTRAQASKHIGDQIDHYQKAIDLVRGVYLEDIGGVWVWPERERLSQAFLSASLTLAELYRREGNLHGATTTCQRTIEFDSTYEAAYCALMRIYADLGDRSMVIQTFEACSREMDKAFKLPPSESTQALYQSLSGRQGSATGT